MTFILKSPSGASLQISFFYWHPTTLLIRQALNLNDQRFEKINSNVGGAKISASEADTIATFLDGFLESFPKDGRILLDGTVTREPKVYRPLIVEDPDWDKRYSASYEWLVRFREFCRNSGGFSIT